MFSVNPSKKRARDEKFGKIGGISQIFGFYTIFFTKYFRIFGKKPENYLALFLIKKLALFSVNLSKNVPVTKSLKKLDFF